jgi:hypothetical protein
MQAEVPGLLDLTKEDRETLALYGVGEEPTDAFGRRCLLARRLVQQGVRFVQLYAGTWLVIWCGEFGRSPDNGVRMGTAFGRDHNPKGMTIWFAGGGVKAGHTVGATDELGAEAIECVHHVRDVHVTVLRLLGLDDAKLTFFHGGRFKQLSQFGGQVIKELLA